MEPNLKQVLSEDEVLAIEILEKAGWQFMGEITIEKGTPTGERWPLYTSGGEFPMGVFKPKLLNVGPRRSGLKTKGRITK